MSSTQKTARITGLLYLIVAITGGFAHFSVRESLIDSGNIAATINNIKTSESLFRIGTLSDLICQVIFIFVPLFLYRIFKPINKNYATYMVILALVGVPIACVNLTYQLGVIQILEDNSYLIILKADTIHALVMFLLDLNSIGILITQIFWGLWLLPLGILIYQSNLLPKIIGALLMLAALIYSLGSIISFLFPQYMQLMEPLYWEPAIAEISFCIWLLIKGVQPQQAYISQ